MLIPHRKVPRKQALVPAQLAVDWTAIWAAIIGAVAVVLALFVLIADQNPVAAAFVLVAVAAIIAVVLREGAQAASD